MTDTSHLLEWRSHFPILSRTNYLISNSLGAMPAVTRDALMRYADLWDQRGVRAWGDEWWELQDEVAGNVGRVLGVDGGTVSMHQNVAMATESLVSCFNISGPRNKIVYTDLNFPSVMYLYEGLAGRGAEIVRVPGDAEGITVDLDRLLGAIDERTLLVPVSHVLFRSAFVQDAKAIADRCREVGAFLILDVYQSFGSFPLQLKEWGVHAAVGGILKYGLGGPGNCFLYVDPDVQKELDLTPQFTGWAAHKNPFAFSAEGQDYREDGGRFLNGTPNVPGLYAGKEGVKMIADIGVEQIRARSVELTGKLVARAEQHGLKCRTPADPARRGGHVPVDVEHGYAVCQALAAEEIVCDYRPNAGIRVAPHFYNTEEEVLACVDRIAALRDSGEYKRFLDGERRPG